MSEPDRRIGPALGLSDIDREYLTGAGTLKVLNGAKLEIQPGEIVALVGPSGAGKSTLLHVAALLERPDRGDVVISGISTAGLADRARTNLRRRAIGFVYQFHHLLPEFSALENVVIPMMIAGLAKSDAQARAQELLTYLGVAERLEHRPSELSGGEQQRVAFARAVANAPDLLLADEPTGNLDPRTSEHVFDTLEQLTRDSGMTALIATHNLGLAAKMDRAITLKDGKIIPTNLA